MSRQHRGGSADVRLHRDDAGHVAPFADVYVGGAPFGVFPVADAQHMAACWNVFVGLDTKDVVALMARRWIAPVRSMSHEHVGDAIAKSAHILRLVDACIDNPTASTRGELRKALLDEFMAARPAQVGVVTAMTERTPAPGRPKEVSYGVNWLGTDRLRVGDALYAAPVDNVTRNGNIKNESKY